MRICIVSDLYYPYPGGVSEHVAHIAKELRKLGHTVKILTTNYPEDRKIGHQIIRTSVGGSTSGGRISEKQGIRQITKQFTAETQRTPGADFICDKDVYRVGRATKFWINKSVGIIPVGLNLPKAVKGILENKYARNCFDILHLQTPNPFLSMIALKYSKTVNVMTFHSAAPEAPWHKYAASILEPYMRKVHGAIAVSKIALETMQRVVNIPNTKIIPNGIDIERFSRRSGIPHYPNNCRDIPINRDCVQDSFNILFVGRFEPRKGLKYLLSAFPEVRKEIPNAKLTVVGGYMDDCKMEQARLEGVHFKGRAVPEDIPKYYAQSDVFCSPATGSESFGIVLLEAMASGTPVIASRIPGYQQVITDGKDGILVEPQNSSALASAIIEVYKNKELRKQLVINGKDTALKYSWDKVTKQIEQFYYELLM